MTERSDSTNIQYSIANIQCVFGLPGLGTNKMRMVTMTLSCLAVLLGICLPAYGADLIDGPNGVVFDSLNGRYLVSNWAGSSLVRIGLDGSRSYYMRNIPNAHGLEIEGTVLYVTSRNEVLLIDLTSDKVLKRIRVPGSSYLGHITLDGKENVYVSDWSAKRLFKVDVTKQETVVLADTPFTPIGIAYDEKRNGLIVLPLMKAATIKFLSFSKGDLTDIIDAPIDFPDAICRDLQGNYYVSSFSDGVVLRFDSDFASGPVVVSTGHEQPSGLGYNPLSKVIGVTNYSRNSVDFIRLGTEAGEGDIGEADDRE